MNKYKFGNHICKLREAKGLTQIELAEILGVSDKAVSKWENGQSVSRKETFDALAAALGINSEALLAVGNDGSTLIYIENKFYSILYVEINGVVTAVYQHEPVFIEVPPEKFTMRVYGEFEMEEFNSELENMVQGEKKLRDKIMLKMSKKIANVVFKALLYVECTYLCENYNDGQLICINGETLNLGDVTWTYENFVMCYPKPESLGVSFTLSDARGLNTKEYIKKTKKAGLTADIGIGFIDMLLNYPLRGLYLNHLCKPHIIKKHIINAEKIKEKNSRKKPLGCLSALGILFLILIVWGVLDVVMTPFTTPAIVAADYSYITYYNDVYTRIDELPSYAIPDTFLGATTFDDAINDGNDLIDQWAEDSMVQTFTDEKGNKYLWLIENYVETMLDEEKEYKDFTEHYVYMLANE